MKTRFMKPFSRAVHNAGGKCKNCGYSKNINASTYCTRVVYGAMIMPNETIGGACLEVDPNSSCPMYKEVTDK